LILSPFSTTAVSVFMFPIRTGASLKAGFRDLQAPVRVKNAMNKMKVLNVCLTVLELVYFLLQSLFLFV
jgi:hypothetical protein